MSHLSISSEADSTWCLLLQMLGGGGVYAYFASHWNTFDALIVCTSLTE